MTGEEWSFPGVPDGIQDSFEVQQLRNRYLAGTAGSPFSDPESCMLFQRMQQFDASLSNKRPVMDHDQPWHPDGMPYVHDVQSMFAPMHFQYGVASIDDVPMASAGGLGQNMPISSPAFSASESGASFGSFSSTGVPNLLDSGSFSSADGSAIITSPPQQFEYVTSPFTSSSLVSEDLSNIKAAPPSPTPFSETSPIVFFPTAPDHLVEPRCPMNDHHAMSAPVLERHGSGPGIKSEPQGRRVLPSKPRKELPEKPRSRRAASPSRRVNPTAPKTELRPKQPKPCPVPVPVITEAAERSAKDDYLLKAKAEGLTYREIRVKGNFSEAESTLRGRYRTLTKSKEERVRKPEWTQHDVHLLRKAVRKFSKGNDPASTKIPWKQVAEYIYNHDGSYLFGNATCRKKWDELVMNSGGRRLGGMGTME
ncbi:hypothetical protein CkaCkLH20_07110 [Colletotrichum karsti]|uniref:Myb-like domain-containing protein n=1 Tax=Colletotrichum karsti TaxID=1095194 RepID=A0A9P6IAY2_9PEZI|nr:uncharacterized protein CkaCkLH20_07110 [Colletotrichum karsti]KAF9875290.1 hypothetical protein CkaCkLH20_07110 [Colletotrichum karsti]